MLALGGVGGCVSRFHINYTSKTDKICDLKLGIFVLHFPLLTYTDVCNEPVPAWAVSVRHKSLVFKLKYVQLQQVTCNYVSLNGFQMFK